MSKLKLQSLLIAIATYIFIIIAIVVALYQHKEPLKPKVYTEKKSDVIEVSLGNPIPSVAPKKVNKKKKKTSKKIHHRKKRKKIIKKVRNKKIKKIHKKIVKKIRKKPSKVVKKKKAVHKKPIKKSHQSVKPDTNKLFNSISKIKPKTTKTQTSGKSGKSLQKVNKSKGIENRYFAKIQNTLKGWPAQSNFAGEKIRVELTVYQSGLFDYKILYRSLNPEFNEALRSYLEQLKRVGFGMHSNPKPYKIIVEFIAK